jgi:hypothetical protein
MQALTEFTSAAIGSLRLIVPSASMSILSASVALSKASAVCCRSSTSTFPINTAAWSASSLAIGPLAESRAAPSDDLRRRHGISSGRLNSNASTSSATLNFSASATATASALVPMLLADSFSSNRTEISAARGRGRGIIERREHSSERIVP